MAALASESVCLPIGTVSGIQYDQIILLPVNGVDSKGIVKLNVAILSQFDIIYISDYSD